MNFHLDFDFFGGPEGPVVKFIKSQLQAPKIREKFDLFEKKKAYELLRSKEIEKLGERFSINNMYEIRVKISPYYRFFGILDIRKMVLMHGIIKKGRKLKNKDLTIAFKRAKLYYLSIQKKQ